MGNEIATLRPEPEAVELTTVELKNHIAKIGAIYKDKDIFKENEHYGVIPGTQGKPTLLKAGAEKLALVFRLAPAFDIRRTDFPGNHREYEITCTLTHIPSGRTLGQGVGSCSTMESKYRWRHAEPESTGKLVPGNYWNVRKINPAAAQELLGGKDFVTRKIDNQWFICKKSEERKENPDIADTYNTVLKIAKKRAQVDATLTATAASDFFTQDIEDYQPEQQAEPAPAAKPAEKPEATAPAAANKPTRFVLWDEILAYCNADKRGATEILQRLTGKKSYADVQESVALTARERFKKEYLDAQPAAAAPQPGEKVGNGPEGDKPGDDIPY